MAGLSINIILLGLTSFLADASSEMMMPVLPIYIQMLGGAGVAVGLIAGVGDSIASLLKGFSGYLSDRIGRRKQLVFTGYFTSAVSKLFFPLSIVWHQLLVARAFERVGKGIRTAPRDALISLYASGGKRGYAFGFHRMMDSSGAIVGSILALTLYWLLGLGIREILWISALIAFIALIPILFVEEARVRLGESRIEVSFSKLSSQLRRYILVVSIFSFGNFSYMFFILKAQEAFTGRLAVALPILLYVLFNFFYAALSIPFGKLSDRYGRRGILVAGYLTHSIVCLGMAYSASFPTLLSFFILYGVMHAMVDANERAFVSDLSAAEVRGTALGTYHTAISLINLPSDLLIGFIWEFSSPTHAFLLGTILSLTSALLLCLMVKPQS